MAPNSVAEHDGLVYVLSTGKPAVVGFRVSDCGLEPISGGESALSGVDRDPAQVGVHPRRVGGGGDRAGDPLDQRLPRAAGRFPWGRIDTSRAEKGAATASSYSVEGATIIPVTKSVGNGRSEICWAVATPDDRFAFTTNFAGLAAL
jgi:6-phosphogluconolactonase